MKKYKYVARDKKTNAKVESFVQSDSERSAAKVLIARDLVPLEISEDQSSNNVLQKITNRISSKDMVVFFRQLATLIGANIPIVQSLHTVVEQTQNKRLSSITEDVVADVESGKTLSSSFKKYPEVFDPIVIALISAGEMSGTLDMALKRISAQKEKDADMMRKVRGAMVYPAIILVIIIAVVVFMLMTIVPQVEQLYDDMNKPLPMLTVMLVAIANFIKTFWWLVIAAVAIGVYFIGQYLKTEGGIKVKDTVKLNMPLFKGMFRKLYMARFSRTVETLMSTGVAILDTLRISADGVNNTILAQGILRAAEKVKAGKQLSTSLKNEDYILPMVPQMIRIGEKSGKIDEMMGKTAQIYEDELEEEIKNITTTIEPILMVVMAVVVGGIVGAILFPIYTLVGDIH